ncbi:MAG TPA: hypothetical protein VF544_24665 [Pyrinomonadaceae bacterium]|jgi:hypothetical protein
MKKLQQFCVIATLTLTLTISAFAGEMGCPGVSSTCDVTPPPVETENTAGNSQTPSATDETDDSFMEIALGLLLDVSSLL